MVSIATSSSNACYDLLENLLNWSRSQLDAVSINKTTFGIDLVFSEVMDLYRGLCEQKGVGISVIAYVDSFVSADIEMVRTVVRNLVSNALKFTPSGGKISIGTAENASELIVSVRDTGVGIEQSRLKKLFSFTENTSTYGTSGEKGTGLGLVLSNEFITRNGGRLWIESEPGVGSSFNFTLPLASIENAAPKLELQENA